MLTVNTERNPRKIRLQLICVLACALMALAPWCAWGQTATSATQNTAQSTTTPPRTTEKQQKIPTVTTTIVVQGKPTDGYLPQTLSVGNLDGASLQETPVSALVVTRDLMEDQQSRLLSDLVKNDASIGEDYAPVGYYGDYQIRGIPIDLATGIEVNGLTIAGEQDVPLENKENVEFLKGIAGIESGVAAAGGLINYTTKRAVVAHAVEMATDHRGSAYGATDLGWLWGEGKKFGTRVNMGGERIASYVSGANGWRAVGTAALDWKISSRVTWTNDFEYQHKVERSNCGYQLLGGTTVPDLDLISPGTMLGLQSWQKPNTFDTYNTSSRLDADLGRGWRASIRGGFSHSLIDDNVVYAYGYGAATTTPPWFFGPDGEYDIYDYRDPGELRIDAKAEALVTGSLRTGALTHHLSGGGELFLRSVQQPGYYTIADNYTATIDDGAVYTYVGTENIYQPEFAVPIESPHQQAGPRRLWLDHHDASLLVQDRLELPHGIQLIAGGRLDSMRDHNFSASSDIGYPGPATNPCISYSPCVPTPPFNSNKTIWLPMYAATYSPRKDLTLYGNYSVLLSLGPQGPWWANDNPNQYLAPFYTRQAETGAKYTVDEHMLVTLALFRMRTPFFYVEDYNQLFASDGHETHEGLELSSEGRLSRWARYSGSLAWMRAISDDSETPSYNDKEIINQPHLRTTAFVDFTAPHLRGLHLMPGWSYTGEKAATRDDAVSVPGYNIFNLGARYSPGGENGRVSLRMYADNVFDKRYWKDTGASYGDTFLHLGAPTTVRLSLHYTF
jgi:iron complex outermembrane recepter protein